MKKLINSSFLFIATFQLLTAQVTYNWKPVTIKGGGLISGLIFSKAQTDLLYARTDVGGAYRWNASTKTWIPLTDGMTNNNDWGIWSLAPDPSNAQKVYMATGLYTASWGNAGSIYGSDNQGTSWSKLATLPFKLGGNDPGRGLCERLQVDPNKPSILFLGSAKDGLYKSTDSGVNWTKINSLSASYINFVEFDKSTGSTGNATQTIYVGVADYIYNNGNVGVYRSTDGGSTWSKITNHPTALTPKSFSPGNTALTTVPTRMVFTSGNTIYFTFSNSVTPNGDYSLASPHNGISNGAVYKYDKSSNAWTNITPSGAMDLQGGFGSIVVHPTDANKIAVSTVERYYPQDEIYFSADGGANWTTTFNSYNWASTWGSSLNKGTMDNSKAPYSTSLNPHWTTTLAINPNNGNQVIFGTGNGVYACYDVSPLFTATTPSNTAKTTWIFENDGIEETVPLEIISPPSGAPLISAIGDFDGFVHTDFTVSPSTGRHVTSGKLVGSTTSIAYAETSPLKMVKAHNSADQNRGSYSTDGGTTWTLFTAQPGSPTGGGQIAVSANGNNIVWAPADAALSYSTNNGASWTASTGGVPNNLKPVADKVNPNKFYIYNPEFQKFFYSNNGGASFTSITLSSPAIAGYNTWQTQIATVTGKEGHVLMAAREGGLYMTKNGGTSFTKIPNVSEAYKVTVGMAAPNSNYPTLFIWAVIDGVNGLFRSTDEGATWTQINDAAHEYARAHRCMTGDPRVFGRLYLGTDGRGIVYGDPTPVTSIDEDVSIIEASDPAVYPNPFGTGFKVNTEGEFDYAISDISGKIVSKGKANANQELGATLSQGFYLLQVNTTKGIRLVKR
jgi:photosystem II stability/assembly factor-like uncharacterized protein